MRLPASIQCIFKGLVVASLGIAIAPGAASAQGGESFPTRPITLIVPFSPGQTTDLLLRAMAPHAAKKLGQPIIVDNKPGASSTLGPATMAATAKADGYTISQIAVPFFRVPVMQKVAYDPVRDFTYIIMIGGYTLGAVVPADSPLKSWADALAFARANPGKLTYTTVGPATTNSIATELMARKSGVRVTHVPSKGGGEAIAALLGGHYMMMVESPSCAPLVVAGKLRALYLLGTERSKRFPDVPTIRELGYPWTFESPFGLVGPKGMDPAVVQRLHDAFKHAYDQRDVIALYERYDLVQRHMAPAAYTAFSAEQARSEREALELLGLARKE